MIEKVFLELTIIIFAVVIVSAVMKFLKQPLIIGHIITGILVSPAAFNLIQSDEAFPAFAQFGVAILLFMVGLHLDPKVIKSVGKPALITGIGQVLFTSILGFFIGVLLKFNIIESIFIAVALTFSSTIIIMKLLSDKGDVDTLYGKISIGFLIVQDIIAMLILMSLSTSFDTSIGLGVIFIILKLLGLILILYLIGKYIFPKILDNIAKSQEFLLFFSVGWFLVVGSIFAFLNFSIEAGALLAGITLALSPYKYEISSKLKPLRDFFIVIFFVVLGSQMSFTNISNNIMPIVIFSVFILIGNPLIVMILLGILGYTKKTGFMSGLTVAQISEFSLILIALGVTQGKLSGDILSLVTIIGIITIAGSTYFILYSQKLFKKLSPLLSIFERKGSKVDEHKFGITKSADIFLFGCHRMGADLIKTFTKLKKKYLVVDNNPDIVLDLAKQGSSCRYGDADDIDFLYELNLNKAKMVISTIPNTDTNLFLIKFIREVNTKCIIIVVSNQIYDSVKLYEAGATYVILPHQIGGKHTSMIIENYGLNIKRFLKERDKLLKGYK